MAQKIRLGVLVPSSNTALEPLTYEIISSMKSPEMEISVHFSRFRVTQINLSAAATAQFKLENILAAAELLADAEVDVIGWSGTSAGWLGFEIDEKLCSEIQSKLGVRATTSTLALNKVLQILDAKTMALVTPYVEELNDAIRANYNMIGIHIAKSQECHLGITKNDSIAAVDQSTLDNMIASVVNEGPSIVSTFCTNLRAAHLVDSWEKQYNIIVLDTVATVVWDMLQIAGVQTDLVSGWGKLFSLTGGSHLSSAKTFADYPKDGA